MSGVLIIATAFDGTLARSSLELVAGARALAPGLGGQISAALLGQGSALSEAAATLQQYGVSRVYTVNHPALSAGQSDAALAASEQVARAAEADVVLVAADTIGRELAPRLAFRLGAALLTECLDLATEGGAVVGRRQVYGGRAVATLATASRPVVASVKPRSLDVPEPSPVSGTVEPFAVTIDEKTLGARVREIQREQAAVGLEDAQIVIGGGRGLGGPDGFATIGKLAEALGGAVGASRPPADSGWVPINWQIGQTGKTIRPALYVAVGISGATQHVAGVSGSRTIVAINRDPEAPIFSLAHIGIVGDFREIVPLLIEKVKALKGA